MTDRFAIVVVPDGQPLPPEAIVIGPLSEVLEYIRGTPAREEAEQRQAAREQQVTEVANRIADVGTCLLDQIEALATQKEEQARLDAKQKADKARRDAEEAACTEAATIREYLEANPEPGSAVGEPAALGDESPQAGGELHPHAPVDKERFDPVGENSEMETDAGGVPLSYPPIPESYIRGKRDQTGDLPGGVERRSPAPLGSDPVYDPAELAHPEGRKHQVPQPTAVSLW
jgi:hypothetical protein